VLEPPTQQCIESQQDLCHTKHSAIKSNDSLAEVASSANDKTTDCIRAATKTSISTRPSTCLSNDTVITVHSTSGSGEIAQDEDTTEMVAEAEPRLDNVRVASVEPQPSNNVAVEEVPGYEDLGLNTQVNVAHVAFATRPQLEVGAPEEEVARYEEMQSDSVRPQLLSETCLAMGLDSDSITCRLVARRFLLVNSCKLQKAVKQFKELDPKKFGL